MMRLIDADPLIEEIASIYGFSISSVRCSLLGSVIANAPTIEPKQGEWIEHKGRTIVRDNNFIDFFPTEYECSNCGLRQATYFINSTLPNYCPNCGARMKGADDETD